jgi:hypothetical protein
MTAEPPGMGLSLETTWASPAPRARPSALDGRFAAVARPTAPQASATSCAQQEWVVGSMNRLAADIAELNGAVLNIAQATASRMGRATRDLEHTGQELMSAAGSKPGTK